MKWNLATSYVTKPQINFLDKTLHNTLCTCVLPHTLKTGVKWTLLLIPLELHSINTLRPRQNVRRFADDTFKRIFWNENVRISIKISLKFVPKGPINNNPALVRIMAWRLSGDRPLSEPRMVSLLTHICVTRPQWVNTFITVLRNILYIMIQPKMEESTWAVQYELQVWKLPAIKL